MNKLSLYFLLSALLVVGTSCEAIGGIFKAGVWVGVVIVVLIAALVLYLVSKASGKK